MPRERTVKLSAEAYDALSDMLKGQRMRAQAIEGLIKLLGNAVSKDKYILHDVLNDVECLEIVRRK